MQSDPTPEEEATAFAFMLTRRLFRATVFLSLAPLLGLCWLYTLLAFTGSAGADGLGRDIPALIAVFLAPPQASILLAFVGGVVRLALGQRFRESVIARIGGLAVSLGSLVGILLPAGVYAFCVPVLLVTPRASTPSWVWSVAEQNVLVWYGVWSAGIVGCGLSFGLFNRFVAVLAIPLFPMFGVAYIFS